MDTPGKRIRQAREARKLTQEKLGEAVHKSKATISLWEKDKAQPGFRELALLCALLKVSADYIVRGIDAKYLSAQSYRFAARLDEMENEDVSGLYRMIFREAVPDDEVAKHLPPAPGENSTPGHPSRRRD